MKGGASRQAGQRHRAEANNSTNSAESSMSTWIRQRPAWTSATAAQGRQSLKASPKALLRRGGESHRLWPCPHPSIARRRQTARMATSKASAAAPRGCDFGQLEFDAWGTQEVTESYDSGFGPVTRQSLPTILQKLASASGAPLRVLDVATGPGYVAAAAADAGHTVVGLDCSQAFLDMARILCKPHGDKVEFVLGDAQQLPYNEGQFDAVLCNFGVLHLPEPKAFFQEAARVLKPGGTLMFTVWQAPPATEAFSICLGAVSQHGDPNVPLPDGPSFFQYADPQVSAKHLEEAGLTDVESREVQMQMSLSSPTQLFDTLKDGTARTRALLSAQKEEDLAAIKEAIESKATAANLSLAMPCVLVTGVKPN